MECCKCGKGITPDMPIYYVGKHFDNVESSIKLPMCKDCHDAIVWLGPSIITLSSSVIHAENWRKVDDFSHLEKEDDTSKEVI